MNKTRRLLVTLIIVATVYATGDFWLKRNTGVSLGLQVISLCTGAFNSNKNCRFSPRSFISPVYLSALVMRPAMLQPLLQLQMLKLQKLRLRKFLRADLNSLAIAKKLLGDESILSLNYECQSMNDVLQITQIQMQLNYLQRMQQLQQEAKNQPAMRPSIITPLNFPTVSDNKDFSWVAIPAKGMPENSFRVNKELYICQAQWQANNYPGQYVNGVCRLTYAGSVFDLKKFVVLTSQHNVGRWLSSTELSNTKQQPIYGGYENGTPVAICRVKVNDVIQIGKVVSNSICNIALTDQEVTFQKYEILYPAT